jgi:hypothetical protein
MQTAQEASASAPSRELGREEVWLALWSVLLQITLPAAVPECENVTVIRRSDLRACFDPDQSRNAKKVSVFRDNFLRNQ